MHRRRVLTLSVMYALHKCTGGTHVFSLFVSSKTGTHYRSRLVANKSPDEVGKVLASSIEGYFFKDKVLANQNKPSGRKGPGGKA